MKINKLKLRGAIGIWKGLGKEEVEIDFENFQPGLIALTGKNGSGKTTIMENLHPYRCMVSRSGAMQSHFYLKDSFRILEFEQDGNKYESKILIDALTGGSEAYLICKGTPINDGKLTTYDEAIEAVLGSQELFFNSVFSGQKSKGIAELKPVERRRLFYELLNLNVYETYLERAKTELKQNELKLAEIEGALRVIDENPDVREDLDAERQKCLEKQAELISKLTDIEIERDQAADKIRRLEIENSKFEERLKAAAEATKRLEQIGVEIDQNTSTLNDKVAGYQADIADCNIKIERFKKISGNKDKIESVLKEKLKLENDLKTILEKTSVPYEELEQKRREHADNLIALAQKKSDLDAKSKEIESIRTELSQTRSEIERIEKSASLIDEVPCGNKDSLISKYDFSGCRFLLDAYKGKSVLTELKSRAEKLTIDSEEKEFDYEGMKSKLDAETEAIENEFKTAEFRLNEKQISLSTEITKIQDRLTEIESGNWTQLAQDAAEAVQHIKTFEQEIRHTEERIDELRANFDKDLERLKAEAGKLHGKLDPDLEKKLAENEQELNELKSKMEYQTNEVNRRNTEIEELKDEVRAFDERLKKLAAEEERRAELNRKLFIINSEMKDWTFLSKAFDKTGIPVLKLENSGIEITTIANELLSLFENKFRIVFETTQLTKDKKKMKETFNINIIADDDVVEISNLSGGQQIWVETAIQLAISLLIRNQGKKIDTSFLDEKDGALDIDNAHLYLEMLKRAHDQSGGCNTFVITHRPELIDLIPQKVVLADGLLSTIN